MDFRIFVGGLFSTVKVDDLRDKFKSFGTVNDVEIVQRKDDKGNILKTFGYIGLVSSEQNVNKCFALFGGTKWKGNELKVQLAKENFITRLEKERADPEYYFKKKKKKNEPIKDYDDFLSKTSLMKRAVPGTPIDGEKNWVVGKYGRPLPIMLLKQHGKRMLKFDPSKQCHCLKKLTDGNAEELDLKNLTWQLEDSHVLQLNSVKKTKKTKRSRFSSESSIEETMHTKKRTVQKIDDKKPDHNDSEAHDFRISSLSSKNDKSAEAEMDGSKLESGSSCKNDSITPVKTKNKKESGDGIFLKVPDIRSVFSDEFDKNTGADDIETVGPKSKGKNTRKMDSIDGIKQNEIRTSLNATSQKRLAVLNKVLINTNNNDTIVDRTATLSSSIVDQLLEGKKSSLNNKSSNSITGSSDNDSDATSSEDGGAASANMFEFDFQTLNSEISSKTSSIVSEQLDIKNRPESESDESNDILEDSLFEFDFEELQRHSSTAVKNPWNDKKLLKSVRMDYVDFDTESDCNSMSSKSSDSSPSEKADDILCEPLESVGLSPVEETVLSTKPSALGDSVAERTKENHKKEDFVNNQNQISVKPTANNKKKKEKSSKKLQSEETRKKSLEKRSKSAEQQKQAVSKALKNIDVSSQTVQKIVFEDSEESHYECNDPSMVTQENEKCNNIKSTAVILGDDMTQKRKKNLFDDSDSGGDDENESLEEDFALKVQFQGKDGENLFKMQQRFGGDERFRMDERFTANDDDDDDDDDGVVSANQNESVRIGNKMVDVNQNNESDLVEEKNRNLGILEEMFAKPIALQEQRIKKSDHVFERYDPTSKDHEKYEVIRPTIEINDKKVRNDEAQSRLKENQTEEVKLPEVSEEKYFEVNTSLKNLFSDHTHEVTTTSVFSFLNEEAVSPEPETIKESLSRNEGNTVKELSWKKALDEVNNDHVAEVENEHNEDESNINEKKRLKFFFTPDDERLEKGKGELRSCNCAIKKLKTFKACSFFKQNESIEEITNQWKAIRSNLHQNYKKTHKDALRRVQKLKERRFYKK